MNTSLFRLDLQHEVHFDQPAFGLAKNASDVLRVFFEEMSPRFGLRAEHMSVAPASVLSDLYVRIGLFSNRATLEVRAEKMVLVFTEIPNLESVALIKDAISSAHAGLAKALPELKETDSRFQLLFWLKVDGGKEAASHLLKRSAEPAERIEPILLGATEVEYYLKGRLGNADGKWDLYVMAEPSAHEGADLFLSLDASFGHGNQFPELRQKMDFLEKSVERILKSLDLDIQLDFGGGNAGTDSES